MNIDVSKAGSHVVLHILETRLGANKAVAFKEAVGRHLDDQATSVILDLSNVIFIDSSALGALISILKRMPAGCELIVCGTTDPVMSMFRLTRLDRVFTMKKSVDEALSATTV